MDRKNRIWLIVLVVLLIAAVTGMILVKNQLSASETDYAAVSAQLTDAQTSAQSAQAELETVKADLDAQTAEVERLQTDLDARSAEVAQLQADLEAGAAENKQLQADLDTSTAEKTQLQADLDAAKVALTAAEPTDAPTAEPTDTSDLAVLQVELTTAQARVAELESLLDGNADSAVQALQAILDSDKTDAEKLEAIAALEAHLTEALAGADRQQTEPTETSDALAELEGELTQAQQTVADLEQQLADGQTQIGELENQIAALNAQSESDSAAMDELNQKLADAQAAAAAVQAELDAARAEYERRLEELQAYRLSRDLTAGEAHSATAVANTIQIAADGVTGAWDYENRDLSGNAVVLSILMGDTELYRSESIAPGERIEEIRLSQPLSAGTYEAVAVTAIYDADGNYLFANRIPVTLDVAK